ncbi:MAG: cytochrome b N-terminal domain-containing protein [Candidatus Micrarchaeota archaeon]|nr:cytochrome b N-terminal domain-containing protein [Candidatus Micrarchaeota archaeon]
MVSGNKGQGRSRETFLSYMNRFVSGQFFIKEVPSYANSFWYSLGFLNMTCFAVLLLTGLVLVAFGPVWWNAAPMGVFIRSVHLWAANAFLLFLCLHAFVAFSTSGFRKPRRLLWFIGTIMFFMIAIQVEFGFGLRTDFGAQYRLLSAADFWNGNLLGNFLNVLDYGQLYGIHVALIPMLLIALIIVHYSLVKMHGLSTPYRKDIPYHMVKADHKMLFVRGIAAVLVIVFMALEFPSPFIPPVTIQSLATTNSSMIATTLINELNRSSGTATYFDGIDPYQFNTSNVYVIGPYNQYTGNRSGNNMAAVFLSKDATAQANDISGAMAYFTDNGTINTNPNISNPVIPMVSSLVLMAQSGLYQDALMNGASQYGNQTRVLRFLSDTGYISQHAGQLGINLQQYGMVFDENHLPTSWLLSPVNFIDNTVLANDSNQDRDNGLFLSILFLIMIAVPVTPLLNELPDRIGLYKLFWRSKKQEHKQRS